MTDHAKNRPPSAAKRWLACPFSATVTPIYERGDTDASNKGDRWHEAMYDRIVFGTLPLDYDPDAADAMEELAEYVIERFKAGGPGTRLYVERRLDIPETGEFGTVDILIVSPLFIEVLDEKSGYIVVEPDHNDQELTYLCGAIAEFGPRPQYRLSIHQPNYDHKDGPLRVWDATEIDVDTHRCAIAESLAAPDFINAGPHCKATYCEHRGACEPFRQYCMDDLALGWHTSELKASSDADLSKALDASDELGGWRTELRAEAMRRIMNMDRDVPGYKVVKGRKQRTVLDAKAVVKSIGQKLGAEWAARLFPDLHWLEPGYLETVLMTGVSEELLKSLGTPKHIEDIIKQYARVSQLKRGEWKSLYTQVVGEYIRETASGLTLERAIDGRPAHRRGGEFGPIQQPPNATNGSTIL
jgi:hypothetical protein